MRVVSEPGRDVPLATAGTKGGAALPRPRPIGEDLARRTAAMRARAQARGAAFPASLRVLRAKCKVVEAGESWPALLAEEALDCLTRLLDEDDILLDIYRRAIMRDCVDAEVSCYMAAHKALRIMGNPDVTMAAIWEANRGCSAMPQGSKVPNSCSAAG